MSQPVLRYARAQIIVHWLTLLALIGSFVSHEAMKDAWRAITRGASEFTPTMGVQAHVILGVFILLLTLVRIVMRIRYGAPAQPEGQHPLITIAAASVHGLLYILLLAIPVTGMAAWFGGVTDLGEVHEVLFNLAFFLVIAHIAAGLFHQFVIKDNLLARMR